MARLLIILVLLIVYGSLYPWRFAVPAGGLREVARFAFTERLYWRDALVNVVFYVPVGACAYLTFRRRLPRAVAGIGAFLLGTALSIGVEIAQAVEVSRRTSIYDVLANGIGSVVGVFVAAVFSRVSMLLERRRALRVSPDLSALALIVCWLAYLFFPFVPNLTEDAIRIKLSGALTFGALRFFTAAVTWFVIGTMLRAAGLGHAGLLCIASTLLIPAQFLVYGAQPTLADFAGAVAGAVVFAFARSDVSSRRAGAVALILLLIVRGLTPLHFSATPQPFSWLPFATLLESDWQRASQTLLAKLFLYGGAVWSLHSSGARLHTATLTIAAVLLGIELAQTRLPHTPDITDPLLAMMIGVAFEALSSAPRRTITAPSPDVVANF